MSNTNELQKVSEETMRFMRGKYILDEVGDGKDMLKFRGSGKTVLTVYICEARFDFLVIFGKAECGQLEARRSGFSKKKIEIYENGKTRRNGKWIYVSVADLHTLEAVKQLIMIKKKPDRKPFPKERAVYSSCGHRCDLCVHYAGGTISEEFRSELKKRLIRVYAGGVGDGGYWGDEMKLCDGCNTGGLDTSFSCDSLKFRRKNGADRCRKLSLIPLR
jgi:uncharacterized membrane protein